MCVCVCVCVRVCVCTLIHPFDENPNDEHLIRNRL